ncbi:MAG: hypothetical protein HYX68_07785 [Planctomycetes bacterium]|nr:hypothetical protein [Planctomycetota bacterium]
MFPRIVSSLLLLAIVGSTQAQPPRLEFRRMIAHWTDYADPAYLAFVDDARPEVVQVGFYGGHFWSLALTPQYKGYPAHFPVQGLKECGDWFRDLNGKLHQRKVKVVGHFNVEFLVGDPTSKDGPRGFFKFYRDHWDEKAFGPRPAKDPLDLMQKNADGTPIVHKTYLIGGMKEYWGCLNNPGWRAVLKAWVKAGIERGVDGYISNYYYRHNCLCEHCQAGFKSHLKNRYQPGELEKQFAIRDVDKHKFTEIVGWHNPKESTPLRREMLRYSQITCKEAYDEVFVKYGRSLRKDLILAQWNHLGNFNQINGDERCLLPKELWGRDEDYAWYSTGDAAAWTDFSKGHYGEGTLQARYLRGAFEHKPFTLGKYENTRIRVAIAEMAANGGAPMGFYTQFKDPLARQEITRYYRFLAKHDALYRASRPQGEVLLLFPRSRVHAGDVAAVAAFKERGKALLDQHILFDVLPDDLLTPALRKRYRAVVDVTKASADLPAGLSAFKAPPTVRISLDQTSTKDALVLHFVNYAREDGAPNRGRGIADEKPRAVKSVAVDLVLPRGLKLGKIEWLTPEEPNVGVLKGTSANGRVRLVTPAFLVYGVVRIAVTRPALPG